MPSDSAVDIDFDGDFGRLTLARLRAMAAAGEEVRECARVLAKTGDNPVRELLRGGGRAIAWRHYPKGDVYDPATGSQFYYHAHPVSGGGAGVGHVHAFMRPSGMKPSCRPAPLHDFVPPKDRNEALSHLIAISLDRRGVPDALFTTNRWVTGEVWYRARDVVAMLAGFEIDLAHPSWPANRWVTAMLRLFRPQIAALVVGRDAAMARWRRRHPTRNAYEDRELEVVTRLAISVDAQTAKIRRALARRTSARTIATPARGRRRTT